MKFEQAWILFLCVYVGTHAMHACRHRRTACGSHFCPTMWGFRLELRLSDLVTMAVTSWDISSALLFFFLNKKVSLCNLGWPPTQATFLYQPLEYMPPHPARWTNAQFLLRSRDWLGMMAYDWNVFLVEALQIWGQLSLHGDIGNIKQAKQNHVGAGEMALLFNLLLLYNTWVWFLAFSWWFNCLSLQF